MSVEQNKRLVRRVMEAFNTGDTSNVPEFISDNYINRESQGAKDSYSSKLKGPEEFVGRGRIGLIIYHIFSCSFNERKVGKSLL
jgi:hypothetical protein